MQPFKNKSKYSPYPGFYDLRVFNLNPKEFSAAWRMQDFLYRQSLKREYYKCFAPLEWERLKDLAAQFQMILLPKLKPGEEPPLPPGAIRATKMIVPPAPAKK